jgi:hypothetical protein
VKDDPEKPIRYGMYPVGLGYLGLVVMVVVASLVPQILKLVQWIFRWFDIAVAFWC